MAIYGHRAPSNSRRAVRIAGRNWKVGFTLDDNIDFGLLEAELRQYLSGSRGWFSDGSVSVDVGRRLLSPEEMGRLRQVLEKEFHLKVTAFRCRAAVLEKALSDTVGAQVVVETEPQGGARPAGPVPTCQEPLFVKTTRRSGTDTHHDGDVVILGDVNPGASVTATGDIVVLGSLKGIAHAGAGDVDRTASVIIALNLQPLQLRIGQHVSVAPVSKRRRAARTGAEIAYLNGRSIVVAPFTGKLHSTIERNLA